MASRLPDFVIAGAMRSGTTSLHHWLRGHPEVATATSKEVHYFDVHYGRGPGWYADQFPVVDASTRLGEATPEYLALPWARERMCRDLPDAKIVVSLRDPVERAWSHHNLLAARGREDLSFEDALDAEPSRLRDPAMRSRYAYVAKGRYAEQLEDLFDRHGRANTQVLIFERDVVARPRQTFERVCAFLGIDGTVDGVRPGVVGSRVNEAVRLRSPRLRSLTRGLPKPLRNAVGRLNARPVPNAPIPAQVRRRLEQEYAGPTADLERLLGTELVEWRRGHGETGRG